MPPPPSARRQVGPFPPLVGLEWARTAFIAPQMHPFDRFFYNDTLGNYTVDRYLESLTAQFGGIDSALLWPTVRCC